MADNSSKNKIALMEDNAGRSEMNISGRVISHCGDNVYNINVQQPGDQPTTSAAAALAEAASRLQSSGNKEHSQDYRELCKVVNKNTEKITRVKVIEDFNKKKLNEPEFEVHPQMRRVSNYFEGGCEDWEEGEIEIKKSRFFRRPEKKVLRNQTRREMGFHFQNKTDEEETLTYEDLLKSFTREQKPGEVNPATAIVASAGSGKTTLMRRLARKCAAVDEQSKQTDGNTEFKMIHYMEMKSMKYQDDTDVSAFLFDGLYKNKEDEKNAYEWLLQHQSEAILYFDGLDQATWSITTSKQEENQEKKKKKKKKKKKNQEEDEEEEESRKSKNKSTNRRKLTAYQKANTAEIMYNILTRSLLPDVTIVISSREFKVSELPAEARPDEIVSLTGLSQADAERLFVCLVGDRGADLWGNIQTKARRLVNLLSIPVFLVLIAALTAIDPKRHPPVTITELYRRIMLNLSQVEIIKEKDQIPNVIKKLKAMAHQGMVEGRVVFNIDDLEEYKLSMQDVRDLMIKVPGCSGDKLDRYLVEGDHNFFFCHQSLQEFLSASFIAEMKNGHFSRFNGRHLHESRWSVVCAFVSGIIHDKSEGIPLEVYEEKRKIFRRQIRSRCEEESRRAVGLLTAIYESDNDDLIQSLPRLPDVSDASLGPDEAHMFSSIWARRGNEKEEVDVNLFACGLNDELLDIMVQNLKDRKIRVGYIDMTHNWFTAKGLKPFLAMFGVDKIWIDDRLLKDLRYEDFDWNNTPKIKWDPRFSMINKRERIEFKGKVNGYFDKTPRTFETDLRLFLQISDVTVPIAFNLANFFRQKVFEVSFKNQIFVKLSDLSRMKNHNVVRKISKILLDCRDEENVDSSLIELCVEKFQVSFLDIVVNGKTSFVPSNFLTEIESHIAIKVKVHWLFGISNSNDITKFTSIVQQNQVENLRLKITPSESSFDDIKRVIENCKVKKLTLMYLNQDDKSRMQHDEIVKLGAKHSVEVNGVTPFGDIGTVWYNIDFGFC